MIKFITVWILTVSYVDSSDRQGKAFSYQLPYATQKTCLVEAEKHRQRHIDSGSKFILKRTVNGGKAARCDFAQVPIYVGDKP